MKSLMNYRLGSLSKWSFGNPILKSIALCTLFLACTQLSLQAQQVTLTKPTWWFGAAAGANLNLYDGSTQHLLPDLTTPVAFHEGFGVGLFAAPLIEFQGPNTGWGFMLQAGYDNRKGTFDQVTSPCNCPRDLKTDLAYVTLEPSIRFAPMNKAFYLFAGPRGAYNISKGFTYEQAVNPDFPDQEPELDITDEFMDMEKMILSMQVGAGLDIFLSNQYSPTQMVLSPFVSYHPYFGQHPRSIDTWNVSTIRVGAAIKFGRGHEVLMVPEEVVVIPVIIDPELNFAVTSPKNIATEYRVRETFPLRNYIFFDLESTEIPDRYVLLTKGQVKDFKEDQLEVFIPKRLSGRSSRQMIVYYNVLNILGDRMGKNPSTTITLVGSSEKGAADGRDMAVSVKEYLVDVFLIDPSRITIEGREKPKLPSEQPGGISELTMLREGDRRVSIESSSPSLLMEFQSGPDAPLKPVELNSVLSDPLSSYVVFDAPGAKGDFKSWTLEVRDEKGELQIFGPYTTEHFSVSGKDILATRSEGDYNMSLVAVTKRGTVVRQDTTVHLTRWMPSTREQALRYSIIYEFNDSKAISIYEDYISKVIMPSIPLNATVMIHGYTDIIGSEAYNSSLSLARANDVSAILSRALANAGRSDVKLEVYGFGEDTDFSPFENNYPEERFYNRTVIIDVIPKE
jgi:hypothetical protein